MGDYIPPFHITNTMLTLVSQISEKIGQINITENLAVKPHLQKNNKIRSIHASLKIEANSLSFGQVRDVIDGRLVLGDQREIQEVKNAYEAYEQIAELDPFDMEELKRMHAVMTRSLEEESGQFRKGEEGVFAGEKCIFIAPPARLVPHLMAELFEWMQQAKTNVHPLILASVFHYEFVFIHPFTDGNGRIARLWHNAILAKWKPVLEYIPLESQVERFQEAYYEAIACCHTAGNSNAFIEFMLEKINEILDEVRPQEEEDRVSEYVKRLLSVMEYQVPYPPEVLLERLGLKSRDNLRKNYINPALEAGVIRREIPDKPRSRNQRYIRN